MLNKEKLHDVYLGLGSNLGDRGENLRRAIEEIEKRIGEVVAISAFYVTEPIGFSSDNTFLNTACHVRTRLTPMDILHITQQVEREMGRKSKSYNKIYSDRTIDIDLLLYDDDIVDTEELILPHPYMHQRSFVLLPLAEIAGEVIHPVLHKAISELKEESQE